MLHFQSLEIFARMEQPVTVRPSFAEAFRFWLKLGFISFGGPTGQIAIMHAELVDRKKWIDEARFLHALNFCMLLPGPEAQQLATYIGWLLHGTRGGLVAGILFVLPSAFILWALSYMYMTCGSVPWIAALFAGLQPAVMALVAHAVLRIGKKALKKPLAWAIAALAFAAIFFLHAPFPLIIALAALIGFAAKKHLPATAKHGDATELIAHEAAPTGAGHALRVIRILGMGLVLWWTPVLAAALAHHRTLRDMGVFFSKAAMVTFGGAYAVLPYVAQQAVEHYSWLGPEQMMTGLGLAESTPGPLIMVLQYVGFVGAWQHPGALAPVIAATLGAAITTWVTFVPCFIYIFLGAPYIERLRNVASLHSALTAITAAVVGVVLNLALWFGWHVVRPDAGGTNWIALIAAAVFFIGLSRFKWNTIAVVMAGAALGLARHVLQG